MPPRDGNTKVLQSGWIAPFSGQLGNGGKFIDHHHLEKIYTFDDFQGALNFTNQVVGIGVSLWGDRSFERQILFNNEPSDTDATVSTLDPHNAYLFQLMGCASNAGLKRSTSTVSFKAVMEVPTVFYTQVPAGVIPTLTEWGLILLTAAIMVMLAIRFLRTKRKGAAAWS